MSGILYTTYNTATGIGNNAFNTAKTIIGNYHVQNGAGTSGNNYQAAITFQGGSASEAQAGIYVSNNSSSGTAMGFATTDSYATGPQLFMTATNTGVVNFPRAVPTYAGTSLVYNSGTWSINVSGTAASISGYNNPTASATANTIVYRDGSGDIYGRYGFYSYVNTSDNVESSGMTYIMGKFGDNYHRSGNAASVKTFLGLGTMAYASTSSYVPYGSLGGDIGLNDNRLYLRTSGDTNHYLWNAADDWEELGAYAGTGFRVTSNNGANVVLYVYGSSNGGYTYSPYSFRAPIFYDSDDTGYYGDFASTSRFKNLLVQSPSGNSAAGPALRVSKGWDNGTGNYAYDTVIFESNDVTSIRMKESDGGTAGWSTGDSHTSFTSSTDLRFYVGGAVDGLIYSGMGGTQVMRLSTDSYKVSLLGHVHMNYNSLDYVNQIYQETGGQGNYIYANSAGSYGSMRLTSTRNGWYGIYFDSGATLMMNSNESGVYRQSYGWQFRWTDGTLYCHKSSYGGGTAATVLDSSNYTSIANGQYFYNRGFGAGYPSENADTMPETTSAFTYSNNAPLTGCIAYFGASGYGIQLNGNYNGDAFSMRSRNGDASTWRPWKRLLTDYNYNDYSPTLTGGNASGTWGINITGSAGSASNATTVAGLSVHTGRNNVANQIVRTDANGYIQAGWINSDSGNMGFATRIARIQCSDDNYIRYQTLTEFKVSMGLSGKNNYSRRIDYSSDANYHVGSFGHSGIGPNDVFHYGSGFFDHWSGGNGSYPGSTTHIHGINMLHYTTGYGGNAYGWQMASQYDQGGTIYARWCSSGNFTGWYTMITSGNIGSQSVSYASSAGSASYASSAGSLSSMAISQFSNNSGYITSGANVNGVYSTGFGNGNFTWYQSPGGLQQYGGSWASFLVSNHGDGATYYNQTIIMPFWGAPQYMRKEGGTNRGPYTFWSTENLDPNSVGGNLSVSGQISSGGLIRVNGNTNLYLDYNYGCSVVGVYSSYRYQGVFSMGDSYKLPIDGSGPGNLYGMAWSHPNAGGQAGYLDSHGLLVMVNGITYSAISNSIWARGDVTAYSDARVKTNVEVIENALEKVQAIRGVTFNRTDMEHDAKRHAGVIAQEVLQVLPEVVTTTQDGMHSVAYGNMAGLFIEAIKEQQKQIEELKKQIEYLVNNK